MLKRLLDSLLNRKLQVVFTPEHMRILVDDLFAILWAGAASLHTPGEMDDVALRFIESKIDKDALADILANRLRDILGVDDGSAV